MSASATPPDQRDVEGLQAIPHLIADVGNAKEHDSETASAKVWRLYGSKADKYDTELAETWKGQTDAMLIFTGLFSAVVSAFIIETYKLLLPDNGATTVALLTQLVAQSQPNSGASANPSAGIQTFTPSGMAIRINIFMFISLFLGLTCALMSTLIQQWAREYLQYSQLGDKPQKRGRVRAYLFRGLTRFQMRRMVETIPVFLHTSVFLFFFAFSDFLRTINDTVGLAARSCFLILLSAYLILSILPLIVSSCPYQTALTTPLRPIAVFLRFVLKLPMCVMKGVPRISFRAVLLSQYNRSRDLFKDTERRASKLDYLALQWLLEDVDENDMDKFVAGLPALIHSPLITNATVTMGHLVEDGMLDHVRDHLTSCMSSHEVSQITSIGRAFACVEAMDATFSVLDQSINDLEYIKAANELVRSFDAFRTRQDSAIALRAACVRALTFRKLIGSLSSPAMGQPLRLPLHILPLARRLQTWACLSSRLWRNPYNLEETELTVSARGYDPRTIIECEGHLINFLVLIRDVLSYAERPTLDLTPIWETLEAMVSSFSITQPTASAPARARFEEVHTDVRESLYISNMRDAHEGPDRVSFMPLPPSMNNPDMRSVDGPTGNISTLRPQNISIKVGVTVHKRLPAYAAERYIQILGFMNKVARGLRLVTVLSANNLVQPNAMPLVSPTSGLRLRHDQIFAKDPFGDLDVLTKFSSALPAFISSTGKANARDIVEKMVAEDGLFRSISEHLDTCINSGLPEETRELTSMTSLQVLVQVFALLEDHWTVHWYESGLETVLPPASMIGFSPEAVSDLSAIHACCTLGIINYVVLDQYRLRGLQPTIQNVEEQHFILKIYDWLCLGDDEERERRQERRQGHPDTSKEASSSQYLKSLISNGPLQNFSILVCHMTPKLDQELEVPQIAWTTLHKLINAPGLEAADDGVLDYFATVRNVAHIAVIEKEGSPSKGQLDLLNLLNTVAAKFELPKLTMPEPVLPPEMAPGEIIAPNRSGYAPVYI